MTADAERVPRAPNRGRGCTVPAPVDRPGRTLFRRRFARSLCVWFVIEGAVTVVTAAEPPSKYAAGCTTSGCHDGYAKRAIVHLPITQDNCDACHSPKPDAEHSFGLVREGASLCTECHEMALEKTVHEPVARGQCTACHDPHGSAGPHLLVEPTVGQLCAQCHEDTTRDLTFVHGPVAAGECVACHQAHSSPRPKLVRADERELCVTCHSPIAERTSAPAKTHRPVADGCLACHRPHGAASKMMLSTEGPALCLDCHDKVAELVAAAKVPHSPVRSGSACAACHDPHGSPHDGLLVRAQGEVCLSCHGVQGKSADGKTAEAKATDGKTPSIGGILAANPHVHGPVGDGNCSACHNPHGGDQAALPARAYPATFYARYEAKQYELCFECHEAEAFSERETDSATGFRNGTQNLHFLHVNKTEKGRTCRACHEPHASKNSKHIAERVPFGKWAIPLGFKETSTGGSCMPGCHKPYAYDREAPITNIPRDLAAEKK